MKHNYSFYIWNDIFITSAYLVAKCMDWCRRQSHIYKTMKRVSISATIFCFCLFVSLLSLFWLIHFSPTTVSSIMGGSLSSYMCSIAPERAKVGSCYSHMRGSGSAADFQTVPTVATVFSRSLCCRLSLTFTLISKNLSIQGSLDLLLYWSLYNYAAYAAPNTAVQCVLDNHIWGLYYRRCYCVCMCWGRTSRICHFLRCLGQLSTVLTKDESPTKDIPLPLVGVFYSPSIEHYVERTSILCLVGRRDHDIHIYYWHVKHAV